MRKPRSGDYRRERELRWRDADEGAPVARVREYQVLMGGAGGAEEDEEGGGWDLGVVDVRTVSSEGDSC